MCLPKTRITGQDLRSIAYVIIGKQRDGPIAEVKLKFFAEYTRFENLARGGI